ncbi:MAG: cytochrome o ubiquinol oxidase subunit III [Pseudomonadota bacterium]
MTSPSDTAGTANPLAPPKGAYEFDVVEAEHHDAAHEHADGGTMLGFWLYLMSDSLLFGILFAVYAVLGRSYAAGPAPADLFEIEMIAVATFVLLLSSITYGFSVIAMRAKESSQAMMWLVVTGVLGATFLWLEVREFSHLIHIGAGPQASAFLSSFFFLVGTHGLHVLAGCIWLVVLLAQVRQHGFTPANERRVMCLSAFWHFLDLIWIGVFSFVYLTGVML